MASGVSIVFLLLPSLSFLALFSMCNPILDGGEGMGWDSDRRNGTYLLFPSFFTISLSPRFSVLM